jgi:hypothetical protein
MAARKMQEVIMLALVDVYGLPSLLEPYSKRGFLQECVDRFTESMPELAPFRIAKVLIREVRDVD